MKHQLRDNHYSKRYHIQLIHPGSRKNSETGFFSSEGDRDVDGTYFERQVRMDREHALSFGASLGQYRDKMKHRQYVLSRKNLPR